jgi:hypothetical protein
MRDMVEALAVARLRVGSGHTRPVNSCVGEKMKWSHFLRCRRDRSLLSFSLSLSSLFPFSSSLTPQIRKG